MNLATLREYREEILAIGAKYGVSNVRVFGSVARGDAGPDSDVDLLVDLERGGGYFALGGFWEEVTGLLGCKVDVLTPGGASKRQRMWSRVTREMVPL